MPWEAEAPQPLCVDPTLDPVVHDFTVHRRQQQLCGLRQEYQAGHVLRRVPEPDALQAQTKGFICLGHREQRRLQQ